MNEILCFGDSNVYGYIPKKGTRYPSNVRWSGILKEYFKDKFQIIEAGCNNRVTFDNKINIEQSSIAYLEKYLNPNLCSIIFSLGINDLQKIYNLSETDLYLNLDKLIKLTQKKFPKINILIVSPPKLKYSILKGNFSILFDVKSIEMSYIIGKIYKKCAKNNGCDFINLDDFIETSNEDGLHFDISTHKKIFEIIKEYIENLN